MSEVPPTIQFDASRAMRYSPIKKLEIVRIVEKPAGEETAIETESDGRETFIGTYVEVLDGHTGEMVRAFDYDDFIESYSPWEGSRTDGTTPSQ